MSAMGAPLLAVQGLRTSIYLDEGVVRAVNGVSFTVDRGQTMAIVGESGSGKSVLAQSIMRILPSRARIEAGQVLFAPLGGAALDLAALAADGREMRAIRGGAMAMIFQEPMTAFSPVHTIGDQIGEVARLHRGLSRERARAATIDVLADVGFPEPTRKVDAYPFELSGGLRQRAMIAMALVCRPALVIADEPTSALDVTVQAQILDLLVRLQQDYGMGLIIITHDPGVVAHVADFVTVMYCGHVMETGPVQDAVRGSPAPLPPGAAAEHPALRRGRGREAPDHPRRGARSARAHPGAAPSCPAARRASRRSAATPCLPRTRSGPIATSRATSGAPPRSGRPVLARA